ncbi:hypothetical protein B0H14DRAFT_2885250 [Mycena olivaceomarginata]|nr:hypothetical protein B0H14DRAFT_2885250 [Mycena olivaceomarginata]
MPAIRRVDSDTTHVSDSKPERAEARSRARKKRSNPTQTSTPSARRRVHQRAQIPFLDRSNILVQGSHPIAPNFDVEARLMHVENEIVDLNAQLRAVLERLPHPPESTPNTQHGRSVADKSVGGDSPIGALDSPLVALSSIDDAVHEELRRRLEPLHKELDEFEAHVESVEARKCTIESTSIS